MRRAALVLGTLLAFAPVSAAMGESGSLYQGPGPRPGPSILYAAPAHSPQLQNTGIWKAPPILISGASAYRDGEFLYQDFLYDDQGAGNNYTYPTDPRYAGNAADFVELRVKPLARATAIRITYNSMLDPNLVGTTIAFGDSPTAVAMPHGANAQEPAKVFVTVHGRTGDIVDAATGAVLKVKPQVTVDLLRRQVEVRVPYSAFDPRGNRAVRIAAATGLWDQANDRYLIPQASADSTHPGGATASNPAAFFNVAFRYDEPANTNTFRDSQQSSALSSGDLSPFFAQVDFTKLARGVNDDMPGKPDGVPQTGFMARILVSHFETKQGRGDAPNPVDDLHTPGCASPCQWELSGRLQPYMVYVPHKPPPASGYGLTLLLHGCNNPYNFYIGTQEATQIGERGTGSIVLTPEERGGCYWYYGEAGADAFEAWADVARHYTLNPDLAAIGGTSMGGFGTFKLATSYPDLFAAAATVVPCPSAEPFIYTPGVPGGPGVPGPNPLALSPGDATALKYVVPSLRNVPVMSWHSANDELCLYPGVEELDNTIDALGYRYDAWTFYGPEHLGLCCLVAFDQPQPLVDYLGTRTVDRDPSHVTYVVNARSDEPGYGLGADHAYWLSGLRLRDRSKDPPDGTIDVVSHGFGRGDPPAQPTQRGAGVLTGANIPPVPYTTQSRDWGAAPAQPVRNALDITASNIASVTIDVQRARVGCDTALVVNTDGPLTVTLAGCGRAQRFAATAPPAGAVGPALSVPGLSAPR